MYKNTLFDVLPEHLDWFHSFLTGRSQSVTVKKGVSPSVPQGFFFKGRCYSHCIYFTGRGFDSDNLDFMIYTDETDMQPGEGCANPLAKLELCTRDVIVTWCANIALICNPGKAEVVHFSSRFSKDGIITRHRCK